MNVFVHYRLDAALIRPGRVDRKEYIDYCSDHQLIQMFRHFYPELPDPQAHAFVQKLRTHGKNVSPAQVQGLFMYYKEDGPAVVENVDKLWTL